MERIKYISPEAAVTHIDYEENILSGSFSTEDFSDIYGGDFDE